MTDRRAVRWLHISDLRCPGGDDPSWERAVTAALMRVDHVRRAWGAFDFVLVSGDLSRSGRSDELARAKRLLGDITSRLGCDERSPFVLAVPGRHDALDLAAWREWWIREITDLPDEVTVRKDGEAGDFVATIRLPGSGARIGSTLVRGRGLGALAFVWGLLTIGAGIALRSHLKKASAADAA